MAASPDAVLHLAALHTLAHAGFASTSRAASVTLSGALARYLQVVATSCTEHAALAGRSKVAAIDVVITLEDLGVGGIAELQEWTADLDKEVSFTGGKMDELASYLHDGLTIEEGVEARFLPVASDEEDASGEEEEQDDAMDVDAENVPRFKYRHQSPDMSWLPPMPSDQVQAVSSGTGAVGVAADATLAPQSVADRYRRPVAYSSSQLAEAHTFTDPPKAAISPALPAAPTSFPSLLTTYEAVKSEPSVALRQTDGRRQAADLLRLTVGNPQVFSPKDTLFSALPPPQVTPVVPSHSDSLPPRLMPVNTDRDGIVSSLLYHMRTPYLPPPLRERLTSLRPPQAQNTDHGPPVLFGEAVRGADEAALAKARGKATGDEPEAWFRATWDSGRRGSDRWSSGRLPTGKKVIRAVDGESAPRESAGAKALRMKMNDKAAGVLDVREPSPPRAVSPAVGIKIRLGQKTGLTGEPGAAAAPAAGAAPAAETAPAAATPGSAPVELKTEPMATD